MSDPNGTVTRADLEKLLQEREAQVQRPAPAADPALARQQQLREKFTAGKASASEAIQLGRMQSKRPAADSNGD